MSPSDTRGAVVSQIAHQACLDAPPSLDGGPWWEALAEDFADRDEDFDLARWDALRVKGTALLDVAIRTTAATGLSALAIPFGYNPITLRSAVQDLAFYERMALTRDPRRFFAEPTRVPPIRIRPARRPSFKPPKGTCDSLKFESAFVPVNPRMRPSYGKHKKNRYAHVRWWRHRRGPRPTVIAIHGFGAEGYAVNQWMFGLPWMYHRLGVDVALFNLPFHGRRQARVSAFSGHGFFAGGPSRINEAFAQAVYDFRTLTTYLLERVGVPRIGVTGISLGGYTTALLAATEPRLDFAIPNVPVASLADVVLEWEPIGAIMRGLLPLLKLSVVDARRMLSVASPLTYKPILPKDRLMVIGGVGDRLAPPKHSRVLWDHWGRCRLHWFPGGHVLHLDRGTYLREIGRFLHDIGFLEGVPRW